jgi:hypothetical protein
MHSSRLVVLVILVEDLDHMVDLMEDLDQDLVDQVRDMDLVEALSNVIVIASKVTLIM